MTAATNIPGTVLNPQDLKRHADSARTAITPADFLRHAPTARKTLTSADFSKHLNAARTAVTREDLQGHAPVQTGVNEKDLIPFSGAVRPSPATSSLTEDQQLMEYAQKWVSQTFFGTMLKQMRESPFKSELFSGGRGGDAFGGLYDQHLADRMARASGRRLAESIVRQLQRHRPRQSRSDDETQAASRHGQEHLPVPPGPSSSLSVAA